MTEIAPAWLDRQAYPFEPHLFETAEGPMHYVDEGVGEAILFVHGNPTWSFEHRRLIRHLSRTHRCIAPDHIGFGLSAKPAGASYLPQMHAANLAELIEHLELTDLTLVIHDWGGPIALSYALDHPEKIRRIIAYNSWFWSVRGIKNFERFSSFMGGPIGSLLCRNFNFFVQVVMKFAVGKRSSLPPDVHWQFTSVHASREFRKGTWVFPRSIVCESEWLDSLWRRHDAITHIPLLLLWGMKDVAMDEAQLQRWEAAFENHESHRFAEIGHFAPEEIGDEVIPIVDNFLLQWPSSR